MSQAMNTISEVNSGINKPSGFYDGNYHLKLLSKLMTFVTDQRLVNFFYVVIVNKKVCNFP